MTFTSLQNSAIAELAAIRDELSEFHLKIWGYAEPVWREYRSAELFCEHLEAEGFEVEAGSAGMPTAFHAVWGDEGPDLAMIAEYDATPGYSQCAVAYKEPRPGFHRWAPGFTDAHSALGTGALGGAIAAKRALEKAGHSARIHLFGEPAEKVCGSKAVHAAKGYYDNLDLAISYHPLWHNTVLWDTLNLSYWSVVFTFEATEPEPWVSTTPGNSAKFGHNSVRSPGALDALGIMMTTTKYTKENMFPRTGHWTLNEAILGASYATADNLPPRISQIQFSWRAPSLDIQDQILEVLVRNAQHSAAVANCEVSMRWVTKTRPGLPNHVVSTAVYDSLSELGPPVFDREVYEFAAKLERELGVEVSDEPFLPEVTSLRSPTETESLIRYNLPEWQTCTDADDYTEYTWHCPTARFFTAKPHLNALSEDLFGWANNAYNGLPAAIDPCWSRGSEVLASTAVRFVESPELLASAREEFENRRAAADPRLQRPLLPADFSAPHDLPWPEYVTTARGYEWQLPTTDNFGTRL